MRKLVFVFSCFLFSLHGQAQKTAEERKEEKRQRIDALVKQQEEGVVTYRKHTLFGAKLSSDGYGAFFEIGRAQSIRRTLLFQLEISEHKDVRELKQSFSGLPTSPVIYGKLNYLYPVRIGVQQQYLLGNKSNKNGVCVTANYGGGINLGLVRPYYEQVYDSTGNVRYVRYNSADSALFLNPGVQPGIPGFIGGPTLSQGWSNLSITPGLYLKAAFRFDFARYNETITAIEVGAIEDFYANKIQMMVRNSGQQFIFSGYVSIIFGWRKQ